MAAVNDTQKARELAAALTFVDGMFAHSQDALIVFDAELRFLRWSPAAESVTQVSSASALGDKAATLFPALNTSEEKSCFAQALRGLYSSVERSVWTHAHTYYAPLLASDGSVLGGYAVAKAEAHLQRATPESEQIGQLSRANAELERFAYVAAHDLQEPVRMVASYTRLLSDKLAASLDPTMGRYLELALDGALRMRALIDGLLAVARVQGADPKDKETVSIDQVVSEALALLSLAITESQAQVTRSSLPSVPGKRVLLVQLFQNLIANALKFRGVDPPRIEISCEQSSSAEWVFHVQDNGIGLAMEHAERAFHLLQRVHSRKRYPGSGVGLTLCKEVVELHGGRISLSSEPGSGTRISFTLKT